MISATAALDRLGRRDERPQLGRQRRRLAASASDRSHRIEPLQQRVDRRAP